MEKKKTRKNRKSYGPKNRPEGKPAERGRKLRDGHRPEKSR